MNKIILVPNPKKDVGLAVSTTVAKRLSALGMTVYCSYPGSGGLEGTCYCESVPEGTEAVIVVGGDGSFLDASVIALEKKIPILGINLGRIGYLAEVDVDDLVLLDRLIDDDFFIEEKLCLSVEYEDENGKTVVIERRAVNDVVLSKTDSSGISSIRLTDGEGNTLRYRADGIIISTPQGSTAYSLSAGGPIVAHGAHGMLVTPVCPHSFFNRAVLFGAAETLSLCSYADEALSLSVDGRRIRTLLPSKECKIKVADERLKTITFSKNSTFTNLFKKMKILEGF